MLSKKLLCAGLILLLTMNLLACKDATAETKSKESSVQKIEIEEEQSEDTPLEEIQSEEVLVETDTALQESLGIANLIAGDVMYIHNNWYYEYFSSGLAISFYGKNVKKLLQQYSRVYALMNDGSVYYGNTLISGEYKIKDFFVDDFFGYLYMITEDGTLLYWDRGSTYDNSVLDVWTDVNNVYIGTSLGHKRGILTLSQDGDMYTNDATFSGGDFSDWKNIVMLSAVSDDNDATVVGIDSEGTVHAVGKLAEEILSWGKLKYIGCCLFEETGANNPQYISVFVGLTEDGKMVHSHNISEQYSTNLEEIEKLGKMKAISTSWENLTIVTEDETIYTFGYFSPSYYFRIDKNNYADWGNSWNRYCRIDEQGYIYQEKSDGWQKEEFPALNKEDNLNALYYYEIKSSDHFAFHTPTRTAGEYDQVQKEDCYFKFADIDQDGQMEVIIGLNAGLNTTKFADCIVTTIRYGELFVLLHTWSDGWWFSYPESGVVSTFQDTFQTYRYFRYDDAIQQYKEFGYKATIFEPNSCFLVDEHGNETEVTSEEFERMLNRLTQGEEFITLEGEYYYFSDTDLAEVFKNMN